MSEQAEIPGGAAVGQMACRACGRAIDGQYFLVSNSPCCPTCTVHLRAYQDACRFSLRPWLRGVAFGFGAAIASAVGWAVIAKMSGYELGILALAIGIVVAKAVVLGAGGRRGPSFQFAAIVLGVLAIIMAKGLVLSWLLWPALEAKYGHVGWAFRIYLFAAAFIFAFQPMDLLWYGIAIFEGWRIPKLPVIPISGPHGVPPSTMQPLSFDTVQPAWPRPPQQT